MKHLFFFVLVLISTQLMAGETRTFKKIGPNEASVTIKTEERDSTQAAAYVDGAENKALISMMLKDNNSELSKLKAKIELENCETTSTEDAPWIDGCGEVTITENVRTSFGRGGWMSGGAEYTFFVGFTQDGTGHFFTSTHLVTLAENAEAQVNGEGDYTGEVIKNLGLLKIVALP